MVIVGLLRGYRPLPNTSVSQCRAYRVLRSLGFRVSKFGAGRLEKSDVGVKSPGPN